MSEPTLKTLLARQGIYDKDCEVQAYELLYRQDDSASVRCAPVDFDGDKATSSVITQMFANLDMNTILGDKPAFINFTYNQIVQGVPRLLPPNRVVVEVLEHVKADEVLLQHLSELKQSGYMLALDDFILNEDTSQMIAMADIIKIDVLNQSKSDIARQLQPINGFQGKLLAEKIETKEQFHWCQELGFDYFQGYFLNKPDNVKGKTVSENKMNLLRLLSELNNENITIARVEEMIRQIPKLSYRILLLANSASHYKGKQIGSLLDAINQLGLLQIRNWLHVMLMVSMDDVATDLLEQTLIRAKMCEAIAQSTGYPYPQQSYAVGMLSTLEGIMNEDMPTLLSKIQLSDTLNDALLEYKGTLGQILKFVVNYEKANFNVLDEFNIEPEKLAEAYVAGIQYSTDVMKVIK